MKTPSIDQISIWSGLAPSLGKLVLSDFKISRITIKPATKPIKLPYALACISVTLNCLNKMSVKAKVECRVRIYVITTHKYIKHIIKYFHILFATTNNVIINFQ